METRDIKEIEAITGAKVVAATKENSSFNSDFVLLDNNGVICLAFPLRDINGKMSIIPPMYESESISAALAHLNMTDEELAQNIDFINPETYTDNTPTTMNANEAIANTPANLAKLHALAVNGTPMFYIWLDAVDDAATTLVYLTEGAARADIARLEADDKEAGVYEPEAYRIINAAPYFA